MFRLKNIGLSVAFGLVFFVVALLTLPHYGINWDTINHLPRGQAYLHYFLTGNKDYADLPQYLQYWQKPESLSIDSNLPKDQVSRRSYYQLDVVDFREYMINDGGGHPPLSDILSALFNRFLFGQLRLVNDIDAYRIYSVLLASGLVTLVFYWLTLNYSLLAGIVAYLSLAMYPLFWSESHFNNEKDIPETVFWSFMLFCFWKGFTAKKSLWLLLSGVFFGLALGTKFNILFIPFILIPWLVLFLYTKYAKHFQVSVFIKENSKLLIVGLIALIIGLVIFVGSWPYLWLDPVKRILSVTSFYREIGLTHNVNQTYLGLFGINTYALWWIIISSPPVTIFLSLTGLIYSFANAMKEKNKTSLLFLLWLVVPIIRVTWPGTTIYGGVRQIMEFIPAVALLAGVGAFWLWQLAGDNKIVKCLLISVIGAGYLFLGIRLYQIHPNENVYFNFLTRGLAGAKEKNIPFWGNSFGAAYRQGIVWINNNLPPGSKISYARELLPNIPMLWLRPDFRLHNSFRSGYLKKGEYVIALVYQGVEETSYFDTYLDRMLIPIYEVKVDGVAILKIWKNDLEHTKEQYQNEKEIPNFSFENKNGEIIIDFKKQILLSRLEVYYKENALCQKLSSAFVQVSDDGSNWRKLPGTMPNEDWSAPQIGIQPMNGKYVIPFAAEDVRYVRIVSVPAEACITKIVSLKAYGFN